MPIHAIFSESRGLNDIKYHILTSQLVNFSLIIDQTRPDQTRPDQTRPDQTRPDQTRSDQTFNLVNLILEIAFLFI